MSGQIICIGLQTGRHTNRHVWTRFNQQSALKTMLYARLPSARLMRPSRVPKWGQDRDSQSKNVYSKMYRNDVTTNLQPFKPKIWSNFDNLVEFSRFAASRPVSTWFSGVRPCVIINILSRKYQLLELTRTRHLCFSRHIVSLRESETAINTSLVSGGCATLGEAWSTLLYCVVARYGRLTNRRSSSTVE